MAGSRPTCTYVLLRWYPPVLASTLEGMKTVRIIRRRPVVERRPDCLSEMLMDFIALDHAALPPDELDGWLETIAMCLAVLLKNEGRNLSKARLAILWLETITSRLARAFPGYPGGRRMIRRIIEALVLKHWEP